MLSRLQKLYGTERMLIKLSISYQCSSRKATCVCVCVCVCVLCVGVLCVLCVVRFVEGILPMNSTTLTQFVDICAGMKEEMAELNTPFEQEQVGIVSERDQNVIEPPLLRKYMLQMSTQ